MSILHPNSSGDVKAGLLRTDVMLMASPDSRGFLHHDCSAAPYSRNSRYVTQIARAVLVCAAQGTANQSAGPAIRASRAGTQWFPAGGGFPGAARRSPQPDRLRPPLADQRDARSAGTDAAGLPCHSRGPTSGSGRYLLRGTAVYPMVQPRASTRESVRCHEFGGAILVPAAQPVRAQMVC